MSEETVVCYDNQGNAYLMLQKVMPMHIKKNDAEDLQKEALDPRVIIIDMFDDESQECYYF